MDKQAVANQEYANALTLARMSIILRPRLSIDGNQWCALFGENLQDGVVGFGQSPEEAYADFDSEWHKPLLRTDITKPRCAQDDQLDAAKRILNSIAARIADGRGLSPAIQQECLREINVFYGVKS